MQLGRLALLSLSEYSLRFLIFLLHRADLATVKEGLLKVGQDQSEVMTKLSSVSDRVSANSGVFQDMSRIVAILEEAQDSVRHTTIMRVLKPESAYTRESEIHRNHRHTFEWILKPAGSSSDSGPEGSGSEVEDSETEYSEAEGSGAEDSEPEDPEFFLNWLEHGSGVFHIAGKPGSGKSTLLKFLANDKRTRKVLEDWATSANKELVLAKFFFWKYGSNDQKSVSGLLRGLLYEMCTSNPCITKLLFPGLWQSRQHDREMNIRDDDIRVAFDQMSINPKIRQHFRLCFFIDGLDEFSGEEMTHWKLAKMLKSWTSQPPESTGADSFLKLCVSSREDHSILSVFQNSTRVRLQDITARDVSTVVEDRLLGNEYFQRLEKSDASGCMELISSILEGAQGVFLWVTLLLNLLEDELPSASSVAALQNIVSTTPTQMEDFFGKILDSVRKHHRRGAYFVLAMAMRVMGFHLSDEGKFPPEEQDELESLFTGRSPRQFLYGFGLSTILDILETGSIPENINLDPDPKVAGDYKARSEDTAARVRTWCRGLLDVYKVEGWAISEHIPPILRDPPPSLGDGSKPEFTIIAFTHRSIPDFLSSIISERATEYGFDDSSIAESIIAMLFAENTSSYNSTEAQAHNLSECLGHVLRLLRLRKIPETSPILPMLEKLEAARFYAHVRTNPSIISRYRELQGLWTSDAVFGIQQEYSVLLIGKWKSAPGSLRFFLRNGEYETVLARASRVGLHEYLQWRLGRISGSVASPALLFSALCAHSILFEDYIATIPRCFISTLRLLLSAGAPLDIPLPIRQGTLTGPKVPGLSPIFEFVRIQDALEYVALDKVYDSQSSLESPHRFDGCVWAIALRGIIATLMVASSKTRRLWECLEVWLEFGAMPPMDFVYFGIDVEDENEMPERVMAVLYKIPVHSKYRDRVCLVEAGYVDYDGHIASEATRPLAASNSFSFAELVVHYQPTNLAVLLGYIERNLAVARAKMKEQGFVEVRP